MSNQSKPLRPQPPIAAPESWYLAQLKPNSAKIAERHLKRQGFQTFLPHETTTLRKGGKFVTVERPLFPGYIFVQFDPAQSPWRAINATQGITRLVSFGSTPSPIPNDLMSDLLKRADATGTDDPEVLFEAGQSVTISSGPFSEFVAQIEELAPDRRVWVLLDIMGGATRVAVQKDQLRVG